MYLLAFSREAQDRLWDLLQSERLLLLTLDGGDIPRLRALTQQYRDLPMDLADAALVRLAEREGLHRIFTIDRRDFSAYKLPRRRSFVIIP
jgi:uncharacterized protein